MLSNVWTTGAWSVQGLGKWSAKFRTGKCRPGIAFTICTNEFHLPKSDREGLNGFEEMQHGFSFGIFLPEKQDYPFRCYVAPGNFPMERPKKSTHCTFAWFSTQILVNFKIFKTVNQIKSPFNSLQAIWALSRRKLKGKDLTKIKKC